MDRLWTAAAMVETLEGRRLLSGSFSFAPPVDFTDGPTPASAAAAIGAMVVTDLNGDGVPDVVTLNEHNQVSIFIGNGNGTFKTPQLVADGIVPTGGVGPQSLAVATINGQTLIAASSSGAPEVSFLTANANGIFSVYQNAPVTGLSNTYGVDALTMAKIGTNQFLIVGDIGGGVDVNEFTNGSTAPNFEVSRPNIFVDSPVLTATIVSVATGDFIPSGAGGIGTDLVVVGSDGKAAIFTGVNTSGGIGVSASMLSETNVAAVYSVGTSNIVMRNTDGSLTPLVGLQGAGSSAFAAIGSPISPGLGASDFVGVGDFNGDGKPDLVAANASAFKVFSGNGNGTYTLGGTFNTTDTHQEVVAAGDFTGDGQSDLVGAYYDSNAQNGFIGVSKNTTPLAPTFTSTNAASAKVGAVFSFTVTTDGFPAAKISASGLPGGLSLHDNGNGTATISGKAGTVSKALFPVKLTATNGSGSVTQVLDLTMDQAATFTGPTTAKVNEAAAISFLVKTKNGFPTTTLTATFNGTAIDSSGSHTVDGLEFADNGSGVGVLNGTATAAADGTDTLVVTATSGGVVSQQTYKITIVEAPVFGATNTGTFTVGQFNTTGNIVVEGFPAPQISTGSGALPAGLSFKNNKDGTFVISGTPKPGTGGAHTVHLDAHNQTGPGVNNPFSFTVLVEQQPVITSANSASFSVGKAGQSFTVKATGNTGDHLPSFASVISSTNTGNGITSGSLPSGLLFTDLGNGTAKITGTPSAGSGGVYTFTIASATDSAGTTFASLGLTTVTQTFTLTVSEAPGIPATGSSTATVGTAVTPITIATNTGFGTTTMKLSGSLPKGLSFADHGSGTSSITGTPLAGTGGTYKFSVTATNAAGSATEQYTLTVDQKPAFSDGTISKMVSVKHGTNVNQTFSLSGFGIPFTFSAGPTNVPAGMTLTLNSAGNALILHGVAPAAGSATITFTLQNADTTQSQAMSIILQTI